MKKYVKPEIKEEGDYSAGFSHCPQVSESDCGINYRTF